MTTDVPSARTADTSSGDQPARGREIDSSGLDPDDETIAFARDPCRCRRAHLERQASVAADALESWRDFGKAGRRRRRRDASERRISVLSPSAGPSASRMKSTGTNQVFPLCCTARRQRHDASRSHRRHRLARHQQDGLAAAAHRQPADRGVFSDRESERGRQLIERDEVRVSGRPERQRHALSVRHHDGVGRRGALRSEGRRTARRTRRGQRNDPEPGDHEAMIAEGIYLLLVIGYCLLH